MANNPTRPPTSDLRARMRTVNEAAFKEYVNDLPAKEADVPSAVVEEAVVARPWLDMREAPKDGSLIEVKAFHNGIATYTTVWRITRRRMAEERAWKVIGFWANPANPTEQLAFEPVVWRHLDFMVL